MSDGKASVSGNNQGQPVMSQLTTSAESSFMPVSSSAPLTMPRQVTKVCFTLLMLPIVFDATYCLTKMKSFPLH